MASQNEIPLCCWMLIAPRTSSAAGVWVCQWDMSAMTSFAVLTSSGLAIFRVALT
ncbi:MAG TPA: hypothetical protein VN969_03225 [Streptosporangiaceae bacterium]|nr:hypothetical protein [Streptosporangiaceae bacterium]